MTPEMRYTRITTSKQTMIEKNAVKNSIVPAQRILNIVLILTIIACICFLLIVHSFQSFAYVATILYFVMGIFNVYTGIMLLRAANRNGQPTVWHKQNMLLLGIAFLFLGLIFLIDYVLDDKLPGASKGVIEIIASVVLIIPFLFFALRSIMISMRNMP